MPPNQNIRILIVDDFPAMIRTIKGVFKRIGYRNIVIAESGEEADQILQNQSVDFIVCDWNMPGMKGIDLLQKVRVDPRLKDLPFIMVTAEVKKDEVQKAIQCGIDEYILKPFTVDTMKEKFFKVWKKKKED